MARLCLLAASGLINNPQQKQRPIHEAFLFNAPCFRSPVSLRCPCSSLSCVLSSCPVIWPSDFSLFALQVYCLAHTCTSLTDTSTRLHEREKLPAFLVLLSVKRPQPRLMMLFSFDGRVALGGSVLRCRWSWMPICWSWSGSWTGACASPGHECYDRNGML